MPNRSVFFYVKFRHKVEYFYYSKMLLIIAFDFVKIKRKKDKDWKLNYGYFICGFG